MRILMSMTIVLCLVSMSCDDDDDDGEPIDIVIKTGQECGWCAGGDSLTITKLNSSYAFQSPCPGIADKKRNAKTDSTEWNELLATLDWDEFNMVQVNTCAVCTDDVTPGSQLKKITKPIGYGLQNPPQKSNRSDPLLKNLNL
jgi:hypothetical protein